MQGENSTKVHAASLLAKTPPAVRAMMPSVADATTNLPQTVRASFPRCYVLCLCRKPIDPPCSGQPSTTRLRPDVFGRAGPKHKRQIINQRATSRKAMA